MDPGPIPNFLKTGLDQIEEFTATKMGQNREIKIV